MVADQASSSVNNAPNNSLVVGTNNQSQENEIISNDFDELGNIVNPTQGNNLISPTEESLIVIPTEGAEDLVSNGEIFVAGTEEPDHIPTQYQTLFTRVQEEGRLPHYHSA